MKVLEFVGVKEPAANQRRLVQEDDGDERRGDERERSTRFDRAFEVCTTPQDFALRSGRLFSPRTGLLYTVTVFESSPCPS